MPSIIRRTIFDRLSSLPAWKKFRDDFRVATGLSVDLVDDLGSPASGCARIAEGLCKSMAVDPAGRILCRKFQQQLLARAEGSPVEAVCDAGLSDVAVPVRIGGAGVGFLVFGGVRAGPVNPQAVARARHLLAKSGVTLPAEEIERGLRESREIPRELMSAYLGWLDLAAREISAQLSAHVSHSQESKHPSVEKAVKLIHARALSSDLDLPAVARDCGVSPAHLSRIFHHGTGLTFTEYVARFRAEHARTLLTHCNKTISEIAFDSGFNSLSQFHRVFRQVHGVAPRELRRPLPPDRDLGV